ncbi:MAG TPA: DUF2182 domain-containing protein [Gemmatimonadaceae bacterium]|nr:DUF2182 domain-containing protein [Gemmatimonadaceae bacterium]
MGATVLAWLGVVRADAAMEMSHGGSELSWSAAAAYTLQWGVMMAAMMIPSAAPMILLYGGISRRAAKSGERVIPAEVFTLVYLALWLLTGVPVYAASVAIGNLVAQSAAAEKVLPYAIAATLLAAGIYQFSAAKRACLAQCQSPADFVMRRWRAGYGATLRLAARHAAYCIGCCWALMVVLVSAGSMSLPWVLAIALAVFAERTLPGGQRTARVIGVLLLGAAAAVALDFAPFSKSGNSM